MLKFLSAAAGTRLIAAGFLTNPLRKLEGQRFLRLKFKIILLRATVPMQEIRTEKSKESSQMFPPRDYPAAGRRFPRGCGRN